MIAIIVDNPTRDLSSCVLIAFELARRGLRVILVPMNYAENEIWAYQPNFVLLNHLRKSNENFVKELSHAGIEYGVLDTEGGVFFNLDIIKKSIGNNFVRKNASFYCSWGREVKDYLIKEGFYDYNQVCVTGSPRFDFYHDKDQQKIISNQLQVYADSSQGLGRLFQQTNLKRIFRNFCVSAQ